MKTKNWSLGWWVRGSILGMAFVAAAALLPRPHARARGSNQSASSGEPAQDEISQMVRYARQGRYDDAVQLGLESLKNDPSDEAVYQQIADIYLIRAQKDRDQREQWLANAVSNIEKSLSLNSKDKDVAGVHLFQDARGFESAGDLSNDKRCTYYERARKLLENRASLLQGEQITVAGKAFRLEPLRKENDKVLAGVKDKAAKAGCK